jgi:hypothetical protein
MLKVIKEKLLNKVLPGHPGLPAAARPEQRLLRCTGVITSTVQ